MNLREKLLYNGFLAACQARAPAGQAADTPPVWTREAGLSKAFAAKFRITPREAEVIGCLLDGKTDKEIAAALNMATNTAQTHLKSIYQKTEVSGRFALHRYTNSPKITIL